MAINQYNARKTRFHVWRQKARKIYAEINCTTSANEPSNEEDNNLSHTMTETFHPLSYSDLHISGVFLLSAQLQIMVDKLPHAFNLG